MKVKFEHERLQMLPENNDEEMFCKALIRRITDSNKLMSWYGDMSFGRETSGYIITWQSGKSPTEIVEICEDQKLIVPSAVN